MEVILRLRRFLSDDKKGNAELAVTAVMLSATLVVVIVGYMVTKQSINAEINLEAETRSQQFNSEAALNTLYRYDDNQEKMINFLETGEDQDNIRFSLTESLSYLKTEDPGDNTGDYIVRLKADGEEKIKINQTDGKTLLYSSEAFIASPYPEAAKVEVKTNAR
jgi:hypothetical protein